MSVRDERGQILGGLLLGLLLTVGISAGITVAAQHYYGGAADGDGSNPLGGALRDRVYQGKTIADMRAISQALINHRLRTGQYPDDLDELAASGAVDGFSPTDMWGTRWVYHAEGGHYVLLSYGADAARGPEPPAPWEGNVFAPDLIVRDGEWLQAPSSSAVGRLANNLRQRQQDRQPAQGQ